MKNIFKEQAEAYALLTISIAGVSLLFALILEHAFGLKPCPLCLMQRFWVFLAGLCGFISILHAPRWGIYPLAAMVSSLCGAIFAFRHLYIQNLPADQSASCNAPIGIMWEQNYPLIDILAAITQGAGNCSEVTASLGGFSIPAGAIIIFLAIIAAAAMQMRAGLR